jgi:hypothetical protein
MEALPTSQTLLVAGLVALLATSSGCSAIGLGIGAATTRPEQVIVTPTGPLPEDVRYEKVRVGYRADDRKDEWIEGRYQGVRDGTLISSNDTGEHAIPLTSVREVRVKGGSYWATGLIVGAVIDVALVVITVVSVNDTHFAN